DESTIVASVLKHLFDACPQHRLDTLARDILVRFGPTVAVIVDAAAEPRFDPLGRERTWKAAKFEHLARLAAADPPAVDLCVAEEMHRIGAALVSIRRLGVEYMDSAGVPSPEESLWWMRALNDMLQAHIAWRRP